MEEVKAKKTKGKGKIEIKAIKNKTQRQVTFSKRRGGLFKKGSELCTLCGVDMAIFTFSPAGKFFCFGHPSADAVIQRYINNNNSNGSSSNENILRKSIQECMDVISQIEAEERASTSKNNYGNNGNYNVGFWWNKNIDDLGLFELQHYKVALEGLRDEIVSRADQISRLLPQNIEFGTFAHCNNNFNQSSLSLVPQNFSFGTRDGNSVAHCNNFNQLSSMSVVPDNSDVGTRDGNSVAHCNNLDDQSLTSLVVGTRDGNNNNAGRYQGFDGCSSHWIDQGAGRDDLYHGSRPDNSFYGMLMKKED